MELKAGYKQTEVGVIPEDWEISSMNTIADIIDPQPDHRTPPETGNGEPYIGISDFIDDNSVDWIGCRKIIPMAVHKQQTNFQLESGDIIFGKIGTIGSPKFVPITSFRYALSANVILIKPKITSYFVMAWLKSNIVHKLIHQELHSTSQAAFGINKMKGLAVPVPPFPEQTAIASALSDMDALLDGLDRLITKKRNLKQAAMQQLLTGKTRLAGFEGEWEVKRLGDVCTMKSGAGITAEQIDNHSTYPCYGGNGLRGFTTEFTHDGHYALIGRQGALCGNVLGVSGKFFASEHALVVTPFPEIDIHWLTFVMGRMNLNQYSESSAQPGLSAIKLLILDITCPNTTEEQEAIAAVLADMDAEIAALEQRRTKTRDIKQGMMQELLTGKVRLI
ncbi:restriction endonuclease subunit S [Thiothrix unzii]|jgi:type I restriction enzyme S subunit|uniref:restriction endonuclease subunit S n=1 Tax=Thiothrix unzii TaxID=111769 RepID=UPI002A36A091|nr:restriction endonuclease subunit S [Thiothrix unzii]MDX9989975.1 restriction endonuclease subunit S [Thiothrix unzii]